MLSMHRLYHFSYLLFFTYCFTLPPPALADIKTVLKDVTEKTDQIKTLCLEMYTSHDILNSNKLSQIEAKINYLDGLSIRNLNELTSIGYYHSVRIHLQSARQIISNIKVNIHLAKTMLGKKNRNLAISNLRIAFKNIRLIGDQAIQIKGLIQ